MTNLELFAKELAATIEKTRFEATENNAILVLAATAEGQLMQTDFTLGGNSNTLEMALVAQMEDDQEFMIVMQTALIRYLSVRPHEREGFLTVLQTIVSKVN